MENGRRGGVAVCLTALRRRTRRRGVCGTAVPRSYARASSAIRDSATFLAAGLFSAASHAVGKRLHCCAAAACGAGCFRARTAPTSHCTTATTACCCYAVQPSLPATAFCGFAYFACLPPSSPALRAIIVRCLYSACFCLPRFLCSFLCSSACLAWRRFWAGELTHGIFLLLVGL